MVLLGFFPFCESAQGQDQEINFKTKYDHEGFSVANEPPEDPKLLRTWSSVVRITAVTRKEMRPIGEQPSSGSAFVVHSDRTHLYLMTARHVLPCSNVNHCEVALEALSDLGALVAADEKLDLALIKFPKTDKFSPESVAFSDMPLHPDQLVVAMGYPKLNLRKPETWRRKPEDYLKSGKRVSKGLVLAFQPEGEFEAVNAKINGKNIKQRSKMKKGAMILHTADYLKGMSGGPLLNTQGQVVGMNIGLIGPSENWRYCVGENSECAHLAVGVAEIKKLLQEKLPRPRKSKTQKNFGL